MILEAIGGYVVGFNLAAVETSIVLSEKSFFLFGKFHQKFPR